MFKANLTNPQMATYSKNPSPTDAVTEIITPTGATVSVKRKRGQNVYEASEEASNTLIEWSKDSLLARKENKEFTSPMRKSADQSQEWSPVGFLLSPAETRRFRELSDGAKERFQEIIRDALRTDPLNPDAKRMIMGGDWHDNTKYIHWHFFVHAHYIDYKKQPPEVSATVINRRTDKNLTYEQVVTALKAEFDWVAPAPSLKETEDDVVLADSEDLAGYEVENDPKHKAKNLINASTMALETKLESIRKRKLEIEEEEKQYLTALHYASINDELNDKVNELTNTLEAKDEELAIKEAETKKALKDAYESEKEIITLTEELDKEKAVLKGSEEARMSLIKDLDEAKAKSQSLAEKLENTERDLEVSKDTAQAKTKEAEVAKEELSTLKTEVETVKKESTEAVKKAQDDLNKVSKDAELKVAKAEGKNEALQDTLKELKEENAETAKELDSVAKDLAELRALLVDPDVGKLLAARNANLEGTAEQKLAQADRDADTFALYNKGVDDKLEDKNTNDNDNPTPNKPK